MVNLNRKIAVSVLVPLTILIVATGLISLIPIYIGYPAQLNTYISKMIHNQGNSLYSLSYYLGISGSSNVIQYASNFALLMGSTVYTLLQNHEPQIKKNFTGEDNYTNGGMFDEGIAFDFDYDPTKFIAYNYSTWWLTGVFSSDDLDAIATVNLKTGAILDTVMRPTVQVSNKTLFMEAFVAFNNRLIYTTPARYGNYINPASSNVYFDPTVRPWYILTETHRPVRPDLIEVVLTPAYQFVSDLKLGQTLCSGYWSNEVLNLAICIDYTLEFVKEYLINVNLTSSTSSFVLESNERANYPVIIHPDLNDTVRDPPSIQQLEFPSGNSEEINHFNSTVLPLFLSPVGGLASYYKAGVKMMIAVSPVKLSTKYDLGNGAFHELYHWASIGVAIPEGKLIEKIENLKDDTKSLLTLEFSIFMGILLLILLACYFLTLKITASVLKPIHQLADVLNRLSKGDNQIDIKEHYQQGPPEIERLYEEFDKLRVILRFQERQRFKDPTLSLVTHSQALEVFTQFKNHKAMSICLQELGKIHYNAGRITESADCFLKCIELTDQSDVVSVAMLKTQAAQALLELDCLKTYELLEEAIEIYKQQPMRDLEIANCFLIMSDAALIYEQDPSLMIVQAKRALEVTLESDKKEIAMQKLCYLEGMLWEIRGNLKAATVSLSSALFQFKIFCPVIRKKALDALIHILEEMGEDTSCLICIRENMKSLSNDILFVVESKFSEMPSLLSTSIQIHCKEEDRIGMLMFNDSVHTTFGLIKKTGFSQEMMEDISIDERGSAIIDSLERALYLLHLHNVDSRLREKWIVLFTEGNDCSYLTSVTDIAEKFQEVNLITVGCEPFAKDYDLLRNLVAISPRGLMMNFHEDLGNVLMRYIYPNNISELTL